jgi:RNA polymerase sigma factor (sigma-70 family)
MKMDYTNLYKQYYKKLYHTVFAMIRDHYLAEDIVQETFIKAIGKVDSICDESKIGAWLITIAKRTTIDFIRKESRVGCDPFDDEALLNEEIVDKQSVEQAVEWEQFKNDIECEISTLRKEQRDIIHLKVNNGWREKEIASFLKMNPATVKVNMFRARKHMRLRFQQHVVTA